MSAELRCMGGCTATLERCEKWRQGGAVACCPDCRHGRWFLCIDTLGRPLTQNGHDKRHHRDKTRDRVQWRDATVWLARQQRIPHLERVHVTAQARYRTRQSPSDTDACAPSVKGCIDGLVLARVIDDDSPAYVASVTYLAPLVGTGDPDALLLTVEAVRALDTEGAQ